MVRGTICSWIDERVYLISWNVTMIGSSEHDKSTLNNPLQKS